MSLLQPPSSFTILLLLFNICIVTLGKEELLLRLLSSYVSTAALVKPLTEPVRLRTAKDMTALEGLVQSLLGDATINVGTGASGGAAAGGGDWQTSPVMQEFKYVSSSMW